MGYWCMLHITPYRSKRTTHTTSTVEQSAEFCELTFLTRWQFRWFMSSNPRWGFCWQLFFFCFFFFFFFFFLFLFSMDNRFFYFFLGGGGGGGGGGVMFYSVFCATSHSWVYLASRWSGTLPRATERERAVLDESVYGRHHFALPSAYVIREAWWQMGIYGVCGGSPGSFYSYRLPHESSHTQENMMDWTD